MNIKEFLRANCPNIPWLRKTANRARLRQLNARFIPADLVKAGEASAEEQRRIVEMYTAKWPAYMKKMDEIAQDMLDRAPDFQGRADKEELRTRMLFCRLAYGIKPDEYAYFTLDGKTPEELRTYVSDMERIRYQLQLNDLSDMRIFKDKETTYRKFKKYFQRDAVAISSAEHWQRFETFVQAHPRFVKKPVFESCGRGVELVDLTDGKCSARNVFDDIVSSGKHLLEDVVVQSEKTAVLNSSSVNTVRVFTFNTRHGIEIPFGFLRTGRAGSFVDNAGSGGVFASIDTEKGVVHAQGCDELGRHYSHHPSSGVPLIGFSLPDWQAARAICSEMASMVPTIKFIGWDLAHTEHGWVVIEGNGGGQLVHQGSIGRGIKADMEELIADMDLMV